MNGERRPRIENEADLTKQLSDLLRQASEVAGRLQNTRVANDLREIESRLSSGNAPHIEPARGETRDVAQKPNTIEDVIDYLNNPDNEERIQSDGIEKVVKPFGWEAIPHPHLPGLTIFWKSNAKPKPDARGVIEGAMVMNKGTDYNYGWKYFDGIGEGKSVVRTLEPAVLSIPEDSVEDIRQKRGWFAEQGALLTCLKRKGKVMRGQPQQY